MDSEKIFYLTNIGQNFGAQNFGIRNFMADKISRGTAKFLAASKNCDILSDENSSDKVYQSMSFTLLHKS